MRLARLYYGFDTHDALLVDYYKTYRIDLRGLEDGSLDPSFMAVLLSGLPSNCEVNKVLYPDLALSLSEWILNSIEYQLRISNYRWTEDAKRGRNKPELLFKPQSMNSNKKTNPNSDTALLDVNAMKALADLYVQGGE